MLLAIHVLTEIMTRTCALQPPARENLGRLRTGEVIPLCFVATQCQQVFRLRCLFHTFGQGLEAEALAMATMADTMARSLRSVSMSRTNEMSIFSL